ncbi:unnamed protein product [Cylicostephanus goldi]|uniref:Amidase domain-containing protein n=1 Tax=Cylicostephanus goldi TaxID=71465 RepID=A0A3P6RJK5_CYLGO|nr:unnamed protein product [Cylicostephanus goldi]
MRDRLIQELTELLGDNGILLFPSWPRTAPYHNQPIFTLDVGYTGLFNALTVPAASCPLGLDSQGLPLGVQIIGNRNSERLLIAASQQLSQEFGGWIPAWSSS